MAYWNPMWEWATRSEQSTASMTGLREPAAKGATLRGIKPTQTSLKEMYEHAENSQGGI